MNNLISCDNCNIVLADNFNRDSETQALFNRGEEDIKKYLENRKDTIHTYWADIEQTKECYIKWCPVCKAVEYFSQVM